MFVKKLQQPPHVTKNDNISWSCCCSVFSTLKDIHRHVALHHKTEVYDLKDSLLKYVKSQEDETKRQRQTRPVHFIASDNFPWLPSAEKLTASPTGDPDDGEILLFYHYKYVKKFSCLPV